MASGLTGLFRGGHPRVPGASLMTLCLSWNPIDEFAIWTSIDFLATIPNRSHEFRATSALLASFTKSRRIVVGGHGDDTYVLTNEGPASKAAGHRRRG